jgi:hypothetical protein
VAIEHDGVTLLSRADSDTLLTFITTDSDREVSEALKMSDQEFHIDHQIEEK